MLEAQLLCVTAGDFELHAASVTVALGECHVILGPTGSGKTLLLESILGLRTLLSGMVKLQGQDFTKRSVERRGMGYVPQDLALFPHLTVSDNIRYGIKVRGRDDPTQDRLIKELVNSTGIAPLMERQPNNLSGGERQRVALVRALASGNKMLLLDEPFSALNESLRKELWLMLKDLQRRYDLMVLMITHDLEEAFFLGDTLSILIDGRIQQCASKQAVYRRPATFAVARFFGIKNLFHGILTQRDERWARITCAGLSTTLQLQASVLPEDSSEDQPVIVGIRATEVMVIREGKKSNPKPRENRLTGIIETIYDKGAAYTVLFQPEGASYNVEIELNTHAYHKLKLTIGHNITVSLGSESLFVVRQ